MSEHTALRYRLPLDAAILTSRSQYQPPPTQPRTVGRILDPENVDQPISPWSREIEAAFYPSPAPNAPTSTISGETNSDRPPGFEDRYLRAFLAQNERLRLPMLWYYTRDILKEEEFLAGLQEKAHLAQESAGWEFAVIGILDVDVYIPLATVGLELGILPRGETLCAHTVTQPPGSVFLLPTLQEDWRFRTYPYLEQGGLYAYAGVPLRLQHESGEAVGLGSLCVASSKSEEPLTKDQQQALVRLADWVVSDLIQAARAKCQRERHQMSELLSRAQLEMDKVVSDEPILRILRATYPDAIIKVQPSKAIYVELDARHPILMSDLEGGLWEDLDYLDALIADSNHQALPTTKTVRIMAAPCEGVSGSSLLMVASKDFHFIFDDVDSWFVETCAALVSQMWRKRLLHEAVKAKEKFLRGLSHQLRTPIHGILGSAELLAEELQAWYSGDHTLPAPASAEPTSKTSSLDHAKYLNIIKMGGRDLVSIINNMITLNRWADIAMTERHYAMHPVEKLEAELCTGITNLTVGDARYQASIFFAHDLPPDCESFWMDIDVLRDSLLPLILNAVRHTPDGVVSIISSMNFSSKQLTVDVKDTGRGIHQDDQRRIFEPYEKVDLHSARAGLGLTLASRFAALLHGSVALMSSKLGQGSHFRVTFQDVEYSSPSRQPQSLASSLQNLPSKFFNLMSGSVSVSLSGHFATFLTRRGFSPSDILEDSFVILDAVPNPEEHRRHLSQILLGVVAICLLPRLEADSPLERTAKNILYVAGPFSTLSLSSVLEQAENLLLEIRSSEKQSPQAGVLLPVLLKAQHTPKPTDNAESTLSLSSDHDMPPPSISRPSSNFSRPATLIVDDNLVNLRTAKNGLEAVEVFLQRQSSSAASKLPPIELIFMDLQMPVCDGIQATQQIRALEQQNDWAKALILVMTGQDSVDDKKAAEEAGGDQYFVKPVIIQQLDRVVKRHFPMFVAGKKA
ncbi:hypothetical protein BDV12DRAFT_189675 [Aspergillus spectabilis]